jgi:signal transduction histidine kinase
MAHYDARSLLIVPLLHNGSIGALAVSRTEAWPPFSPDEQQFLQDFANRVALMLDSAHLTQQLADSEQQLRDLVGRLLTSQDEERRRVAYEVHDGLAQLTATVHQHLQAYAQHYRPRTPHRQAMLEQLQQLAQQAVSEARQVIADLRPTVLDDFGLASALESQVEGLQRAGLQVTYTQESGAERLPPQIETTLFRVAQEAMNNVRKHAQTTKLHVHLERDQTQVRLVVEDWGRGFDARSPGPQAGPGERVGLPGMRERVALVGGSCQIESAPGTGTRVIATIPLDQSRRRQP